MIELKVYGARLPNGDQVRRECEVNIDLRWIRNPHRLKRLRDLTGADQAVINQVIKDGGKRLEDILYTSLYVIRDRASTGKIVKVGLCCTSGRHRSVVVAHALRDLLEARGERVQVSYYGKYQPTEKVR